MQDKEAEANPGCLLELPKPCFSRLWRRCTASKPKHQPNVSDYLFVGNGWLPTSSFFIHREDLKTFDLTSHCQDIKIMTFCFNWKKLEFDQELSHKYLSRCIGKTRIFRTHEQHRDFNSIHEGSEIPIHPNISELF